MKRVLSVAIAAACAAFVLSRVGGAAAPACDPDNGGIKLPQGFCAAVVADNLGQARHLAIAPNGDLFVSLQGGRGGAGGGIVALRDADGDGKFETKEQFGQGSATGIGLRNGYIYYATPTSIVRYKLPAGHLKPAGEAEIIAQDLPDFYFGRIDVRFASLNALRRCEGFRIIEINGAGSEATHIWDPATTLPEAWRVQFFHYGMAFRIGAANRARGHRPTGLRTIYRLWRLQKRLMAAYPLAD